ncbi:MAG: hypothetical protein GXY70_06185 [Euryarchaeota archaeon]|nr:hypothetical protein [Euryarchaeota archaeon]
MRHDRRGIEGLPLRLMLVALLISLTLPTMLSFMHGASSQMAGERAASIAEDISIAAENMGSAGPGNVRTVSVPNDLPGTVVLRLGGEEGDVNSTRVTWYSGASRGARYLRGVAILTDDGIPLSLSAGDSIRLECPPGAWGTVKVTRA